MSKVALITGTNSGIGYALTLEFSKRGVTVYATDVKFDESTLKKFSKLNNVNPHILDVCSNNDILKIRNLIEIEQDGKLNYLYNNAGIVTPVHCTDIDDFKLQKIFQINVFGPIKLTREFIKLIISNQGTIIFSGSVTKNLPLHCNSLYTSTKAALDQYINVLQLETRNFNIKIIEIIGGLIKTNIFNEPINTVPENSIYNFTKYTKIFSNRKKVLEKNDFKKMDTKKFAEKVLDKIEKADLNTFRILEGGDSSKLYYFTNFLPRYKLLDSMLDMFDLNFNYRNHSREQKL